jgi:hypothetical protein
MTERRASSADRLTGFWDPCGPIASGLRPAESDFEAAILGALTDSVPPPERRWRGLPGGRPGGEGMSGGVRLEGDRALIRRHSGR